MGMRKSHVRDMYKAAQAYEQSIKDSGHRVTGETRAALDKFRVLEIDASPEERETFRKIWE